VRVLPRRAIRHLTVGSDVAADLGIPVENFPPGAVRLVLALDDRTGARWTVALPEAHAAGYMALAPDLLTPADLDSASADVLAQELYSQLAECSPYTAEVPGWPDEWAEAAEAAP